MRLQVHRDWGISTGIESTVGDKEGSHVTASFESTYGDSFEKTNQKFKEKSFTEEDVVIGSDLILYTGTDYDVWEYPLYERNSTTPDSYITVVFPQETDDGYGFENKESSTAKPTCPYRPGHQTFNLWTYPASTAQIADVSTILMTMDATVDDGMDVFSATWEEVTSEEMSSEVKLGFHAGVEAQVGGKMPILPFKLPFTVKIKVEGDYSQSKLSSQSLTCSDKTEVTGAFDSIRTDAVYSVKSYLYWAEGGYLALDYVVIPPSPPLFSV